MSDGRSFDDADRVGPDDSGRDGDPGDARVGAAMAAFTDQVRPSSDAWERIDDRLDDSRARRLGRPGSALGAGAGRRPLLVAASFVVVLLIAGALVARARSTEGALEVATTPADPQALSIVAVTDDGRLVELDPDGVERREIYHPDAAVGAGRLTGAVAVSPADGTVFVERVPSEPVLCGDIAYSSYAGEIVAIPFDGGAPRVVAPVGFDPAYLPGRNWLAYALPADGHGCTSALAVSSVAVVDLATGAPVAVVPTEDPVLLGGPSSLGVTSIGGPPVIDLEWAPAEASLYVLAGLAPGSTAPPWLQRVDFAPRGAEVLDRVTLPLPTWSDLDAVDGSGPMTVASSLVSLGLERGGGQPTDRLLRSSSQLDDVVSADGGHAWVSQGDVDVDEIAVESNGDGTTKVVSMASSFTIQHAAFGLGPLGDSRIDRDAATGQVLVTAPEVETPAASWAAFTFPQPVVAHLFRWNGTDVREIGSGIVAATWVRSPVAPAVSVPSGTDPPVVIQPLPLPTTTIAIAIPPPPTTVAPTDRLDDRAAITNAFRAFFEHGDRSALEGSGVLEAAMDEGSKTVEGGGKGVTVTIDGITFTGDGSAEVQFRLDQGGDFFTAPTLGTAVFLDGRWKVSAATMCTLLSRVQIPCPATP